jgi:hypothetical protein
LKGWDLNLVAKMYIYFSQMIHSKTRNHRVEPRQAKAQTERERVDRSVRPEACTKQTILRLE